jgi:hypothetical protein
MLVLRAGDLDVVKRADAQLRAPGVDPVRTQAERVAVRPS